MNLTGWVPIIAIIRPVPQLLNWALARAGFTNALFIRLIGITVYNSFIIIPDTLKLCLLCTLCVSLYVYVFCGQNINQEVQFSNIHLDVYEYVI